MSIKLDVDPISLTITTRNTPHYTMCAGTLLEYTGTGATVQEFELKVDDWPKGLFPGEDVEFNCGGHSFVGAVEYMHKDAMYGPYCNLGPKFKTTLRGRIISLTAVETVSEVEIDEPLMDQ